MTERQTLENVAAIKLRTAAEACRNAVDALRDLETDEAWVHASELWGATSMMERWARALKRQHRAKQRDDKCS